MVEVTVTAVTPMSFGCPQSDCHRISNFVPVGGMPPSLSLVSPELCLFDSFAAIGCIVGPKIVNQ